MGLQIIGQKEILLWIYSFLISLGNSYPFLHPLKCEQKWKHVLYCLLIVSQIYCFLLLLIFSSFHLWKFPMLISMVASLNVFYFREILSETQQKNSTCWSRWGYQWHAHFTWWLSRIFRIISHLIPLNHPTILTSLCLFIHSFAFATAEKYWARMLFLNCSVLHQGLCMSFYS